MKNWFMSIRLPMAAADDRKALRQFAWQMAIAFPLFFCLIIPWLLGHVMPLWPLVVSGILLSSALLVPVLLYPCYVVWIVIASILGWMNTQLILALIFFVLIMPLGLVLRLFGKLTYQTKPVEQAESYWLKRDKPPKAANLEEPF
ncbi:SxtJ family membrane protein [Alteromonas flava]|uniref:SxtJ family membrane protein n=1 Tax=Alteromonas flava TaxID=2048003 RepID=UPI001F0B8B30|nr:SxtJ family membrane protein [Alteromonas flava]